MNTPKSPAMVEVDRLPELPKGYMVMMTPDPEGTPAELFFEDDMRAYATEAIAAERAEVVRLMGDLRASEEDRLELHKANLRLSAECEKLRAALSDEKTAFYAGYGAAHDDINNSRAPVIQIAWDRRAALATPTQGAQS